jgi:hypothetical protein
MQNLLRSKDFWSGIMFLAFALTGIVVAHGYAMGTSNKMGPGYFPVALSLILGALGLVLGVRAFFIEGEALSRFRLLPLILMTIGVVVFGFTIEQYGLVVATVLTIVIACLAGRESGWIEVALIAFGLAAFSVIVFHTLLMLPLQVWPDF